MYNRFMRIAWWIAAGVIVACLLTLACIASDSAVRCFSIVGMGAIAIIAVLAVPHE
jgi:hypothetical protein